MLAEYLPRLGVGELVTLDYDRATIENKNRSHGASRRDLAARELKVDIARRLAIEGATAPYFSCTARRLSVVEAESMPHLLDCDIILNAADSPWARRVLDKLAYAHLIPVIGGGTELKGNPDTFVVVAGKSEVTASGPGHPCGECSGTYALTDVSDAQERPEVRRKRGYVNTGTRTSDIETRAPSGVGNNAQVAGLMLQRLQALALAITPGAIIGTQRYHITEGTMTWGVVRSCQADCGMARLAALGDSVEIPHGVDHDFAAMLIDEQEEDRTLLGRLRGAFWTLVRNIRTLTHLRQA
jgi:hypothetical protein